MSRTTRVVKGIGATYLSFVIKAGIRLAVTPFYLSQLGAELMGFSAFVRGMTRFLDLMDMGIGTGLTAIVARDMQPGVSESKKEQVLRKLRAGGQIQIFFALISIILTVILALFLDSFAQGLPEQHLRMAQFFTILAGLSFALALASGPYKALLVGKQLIAQNVAYGIVSVLLGTVVGVTLVACGWSLFGLALAMLVSALFFFLQVRWRALKMGVQLGLHRGPMEKEAMKNVAHLGGWILVASFGGLLGVGAAGIILGVLPSQGMSVVNSYALLLTVPMMIQLQANRISVIIRPGLTQLVHSGKQSSRARHVARLLVRSTGLLGALAFLGIWYVNGTFVTKWVGAEYYPGDTANLLLAAWIGLSIWVFGFMVLMEVHFAYKKRGIAFLVTGIVTFLSTIALAPSLGIKGVLIAALGGQFVGAVGWVLPSTLKWLAESESFIQDIFSLVWVPLALVCVGVVVHDIVGVLSISWWSICFRSIEILASVGLIGGLWLGRDFGPFLKQMLTGQGQKTT